MGLTLTLSLLALLCVFLAYIYPKETTKRKVFNSHLDLLNFLYIIGPVVGYIFVSNPLLDLLKNPSTGLIPSDIILFLIFLSAYSVFTGTGLHTSSKIVSYYLKKEDNAYNTNEFFHITLSHSLIFLGLILLAVVAVLLELNHPFQYAFSELNIFFLMLMGAFTGVALGLGIVWSNVIKFNLVVLAASILFILAIYWISKLSIGQLPISSFSFTLLFSSFLTIIIKLQTKNL